MNRPSYSHRLGGGNASIARDAQKLPRQFFARPAEIVAEALIGTILIRRTSTEEFRARIVETEAYVGAHDLACHAAKGRTPRTEIMFGPAGYAYVYFIYGMHAMLNIVTGKAGDPQAVLIRAAEPLAPLAANLTGPGRLTKNLRITTADNATDLTADQFFFLARPRKKPQILRTARIGVDYAGDWRHQPLRFIDANSPALSGPRRLNTPKAP